MNFGDREPAPVLLPGSTLSDDAAIDLAHAIARWADTLGVSDDTFMLLAGQPLAGYEWERKGGGQ